MWNKELDENERMSINFETHSITLLLILSLVIIMTLPYVNVPNYMVDAQLSTIPSVKQNTSQNPIPSMGNKISNIQPSSFNVTQIFNKTGLSFLNVIYQGNNTIVFRLDEESFVIPGVDSELGKGIDVLTHYGYKFDQIVTSGVGSQGNPTRFYVIMSKEIPHP